MKYAIVNKAVGVLKSEPKEASENADEVLFGMNVEILKEARKQLVLCKNSL